ncbi:MAG: LysR family transcriptional regulator [Rhodoblastus sp.]|nr:MAG: LysR family transcriptional regulator [Rhodoblastus sp.]
MNFQQLRILRETVRRGFNLTETATALNTSQSGVSKHIKDLELELGVELFERRGKRVLGLTDAGRQVIGYVDRILIDAASVKRVTEHLRDAASGALVIATTHTQARYVLPPVIKRFRDEYPSVHLELRQADPQHIVGMLRDGGADIGVATESVARVEELVAFPYYTWRHVVIAPRESPLAAAGPLSLADVAAQPIVTYGEGFTGRPIIDAAFRDAGLTPDIVVSAIDSDVIKAYVALGLGVGVIAEMALDPQRDHDLALVASGLFAPATSYIAVLRGRYLRGYAHRFLEICRSDLTEAYVRKALDAQPR